MGELDRKFDTCFFERYAKISLEQLLGSKYANLVNYDRPDLQDKEQSIGVEVTRAIRENKNVAHSLINKIAGKPVTDVESSDFGDIRRYGYAYGLDSEGWIGSLEYNYWALALPLKRIIESKVHKVTDGFYGDFKEFDLYIFSQEVLTSTDVQNAIDLAAELQYGKERHYRTLFLSHIQSMYVCDLDQGTYTKVEISSQQRHDFYRLAIQ